MSPLATGQIPTRRELRQHVAPLTPTEFEVWTRDTLLQLGWQDVVVVGGAGDRGVDLVGSYGGRHCIVQCKHVLNGRVTPRQVRELFGALHMHGAERAYLITSGGFTAQARNDAASLPVELWDLEELARQIGKRG